MHISMHDSTAIVALLTSTSLVGAVVGASILGSWCLAYGQIHAGAQTGQLMRVTGQCCTVQSSSEQSMNRRCDGISLGFSAYSSST